MVLEQKEDRWRHQTDIVHCWAMSRYDNTQIYTEHSSFLSFYTIYIFHRVLFTFTSTSRRADSTDLHSHLHSHLHFHLHQPTRLIERRKRKKKKRRRLRVQNPLAIDVKVYSCYSNTPLTAYIHTYMYI